MIYFVKNPLNNTVRIDRSPLPMARVKALNKQCGINLELLGVIHTDNDKLLQYQLGERFHYNKSNYGWFPLNDKLQAYIDKHAVKYEDPVKQWRTVRIPFKLYERLTVHKGQTDIPIAAAVKTAVEHYLKNYTGAAR